MQLASLRKKPENALDYKKERTFSETKKDVRKRQLVTYDLLENKRYSYLIKLIELMTLGPARLASLNQHVLPITTPAERYDEITKKLKEKDRRAKERKIRRKEKGNGEINLKTKAVTGSYLQERSPPAKLEEIEELEERMPPTPSNIAKAPLSPKATGAKKFNFVD